MNGRYPQTTIQPSYNSHIYGFHRQFFLSPKTSSQLSEPSWRSRRVVAPKRTGSSSLGRKNDLANSMTSIFSGVIQSSQFTRCTQFRSLSMAHTLTSVHTNFTDNWTASQPFTRCGTRASLCDSLACKGLTNRLNFHIKHKMFCADIWFELVGVEQVWWVILPSIRRRNSTVTLDGAAHGFPPQKVETPKTLASVSQEVTRFERTLQHCCSLGALLATCYKVAASYKRYLPSSDTRKLIGL